MQYGIIPTARYIRVHILSVHSVQAARVYLASGEARWSLVRAADKAEMTVIDTFAGTLPALYCGRIHVVTVDTYPNRPVCVVRIPIHPALIPCHAKPSPRIIQSLLALNVNAVIH